MKKILTPSLVCLSIFGVFMIDFAIAQTTKPKPKTTTTQPAKAKTTAVTTPKQTVVAAPKPAIPSIPSVVIGPQTWMTKNLDVVTFANGDKIDQAQSDEEWLKAAEESRPAWCYYEGDAEKGKTYGFLYNWFAVGDSRGLAPKGWHVPTKYEWIPMLDYLGGKDVAGNKLKSKTLWEAVADVDRNGYDSLGFSAFPAGLRFPNASFGLIGQRSQYWTATENNSLAGAFVFFGITKDVDIDRADKKFGYSVRCMKD